MGGNVECIEGGVVYFKSEGGRSVFINYVVQADGWKVKVECIEGGGAIL